MTTGISLPLEIIQPLVTGHRDIASKFLYMQVDKNDQYDEKKMPKHVID